MSSCCAALQIQIVICCDDYHIRKNDFEQSSVTTSDKAYRFSSCCRLFLFMIIKTIEKIDKGPVQSSQVEFSRLNFSSLEGAT